MPIINIGLEGYIDYTTTDNSCYGNSNGIISINTIIFDNLYPSFIEYIINWTSIDDEIDSDQIRNSGKSLIGLPAGIYSFTIESLTTSSSLGPFNISILQPQQFQINKIKSSQYSCGDNGYILVGVSGGVPPYFFNVGTNSTSSNSNEFFVSELSPALYDISITDSNGCLATNNTSSPSSVTIKSASFSRTQTSILPPEILDSYGQFEVGISGYGPFGFDFFGPVNINFDSLDTTNLYNYDPETNFYTYKFKNYFFPGEYSVNIKNSFNCSTNFDLTLPNLQPMSASINIIPNSVLTSSAPKLLFPIFDTIFIPFFNIEQNTSLWQWVQKSINRGKIDVKANESNGQYSICRTFLYPYCTDNNNIEIVRLDNNKNNWYFCFHIAPGIDIRNNLDLIGSDIFLLDKENNTEYRCLLGLNDHNEISSDYPSLLIGSLSIPGLSNEEFYDGATVLLKISDIQPQETESYDFIVKDVKTNIYFNSYIPGYSTSIYFLENFNRVASYVNINDTACTISNEDFQYVSNIKKLILNINNFDNYQSLYIFNKNFINNIGAITLFITGNPTVVQNENLIDNEFFIDYYSFDENSDKLYSFYQNEVKISNTLLLNNISEGYVLVRIRDKNNNKIKFINLNGSAINYDKHFIESNNFLQQYNKKIKNLFEYGDILVYVPKTYSDTPQQSVPGTTSITFGSIPTIVVPVVDNNQPINSIVRSTIQQSNDLSNTAKLFIDILPINAVCYLTGPKNYKQKFIGPTVFENVVPGVYNVVGDSEYLNNNSLYQTNTRIVVLKNQEYIIDIKFNDYIDKIFIKE
jgi:hypothetical protein